MKRYSYILRIVCILLVRIATISGQEDVILHDSLIAHADVLEVDAEFQSGRTRKFTLGNYTIYADEQWSGTESKTREKLTGPGSVSNIKNYFSFIISSGVDSAEVYMEENSKVNTYYPFAESENFSLGKITSTKLISHAAWITINGDTNTIWTLYVPVTKKSKFHFEMLLSDGVKFMNVSPVSSDPYFNYAHPLRSALKMPAMGATFIDDGKFICAVQYASGAQGNYASAGNRSYGCKVWMHHDLDERSKLVLAAAVATLILKQNPYLGIHQD